MSGNDGIYLDDDGLAGVVSSLKTEASSLDDVVVVGSGGDLGYKMDTAAVDLSDKSASSLTSMSTLIGALASALDRTGVSVRETDNEIVTHTGGDQPI